MQIKFIDAAELADMLRFTKPRKTIDNGGQQVHVIRHSGADMLAVVNPLTGGAVCIYPPKDAIVHQPARDEEMEALLYELTADLGSTK